MRQFMAAGEGAPRTTSPSGFTATRSPRRTGSVFAAGHVRTAALSMESRCLPR